MAYAELSSTNGEAQTIVDTATRAAEPHQLEPGKVYAFNTPSGVHKVDLTGPEYRDVPERKTGTTTVRDVGSFTHYYGKHADNDSEIYADAERLTVTAVLDAHTETGPRWGGHRLHLDLRESDAWQQWTRSDGTLMSQEKFAEFIEDHLPELIEPDSATMLEIAQSLQATTSVDFQSGHRLQDGQRQLKYVETTQAKAGAKGELTIPEVFTVGLVPFDNSEGYRLTARLRYRISGSELSIGYKLERPKDVQAAAFADVLEQISGDIGVTVMTGTPG